MLGGPAGRTVRVLGNEKDSLGYALRYLAAEMFPRTFLEGRTDGVYRRQPS